MSTIPPFYSAQFIDQRFNKALQIVQHLPPTSGVQPTREAKLELYALYKQAVEGDVKSQRPGIFDVVGRAKWDAWKKLQGLAPLEAKHRYVEALLKVAVEAYKNPASKSLAAQIIQTFADMQPSTDQGAETDTSGSDDESSVASAEAEEQAYLLEIQRDQRAVTPSRSSSSRRTRTSAESFASRQKYQDNNRSRLRTPSSIASSRRTSRASSVTTVHTAAESIVSTNDKRMTRQQQQQQPAPRGSSLFDEPFDPHVNPWAYSDNTARKYNGQSADASSTTSRRLSALGTSMSPYSRPFLSPSSPSYHPVSSAASTVTATGPTTITATNSHIEVSENIPNNNNNHSIHDESSRGVLTEQQYTSVVALGPATKRALDTLQAEIVALNERIDGLRREIADQRRRRDRQYSEEKDKGWEGWKWVIKSALKHAAWNLFILVIVFFALYRRKNPIAYVIIDQIKQYWKKTRLRLTISKIVV